MWLRDSPSDESVDSFEGIFRAGSVTPPPPNLPDDMQGLDHEFDHGPMFFVDDQGNPVTVETVRNGIHNIHNVIPNGPNARQFWDMFQSADTEGPEYDSYDEELDIDEELDFGTDDLILDAEPFEASDYIGAPTHPAAIQACQSDVNEYQERRWARPWLSNDDLDDQGHIYLPLIYNPVSGSSTGAKRVQDTRSLVEHIFRQDRGANWSPVPFGRETKSEGDGQVLARRLMLLWFAKHLLELSPPLIFSRWPPQRRSVIHLILVGGDGTTHEVLNGLYSWQFGDKTLINEFRALLEKSHDADDEDSSSNTELADVDLFDPDQAGPQIRLAIVPAGTANALYHAMYSPTTLPVRPLPEARNFVSPFLDDAFDGTSLESVRSMVERLVPDELVPAPHEVHGAPAESKPAQSMYALPLMLNELIVHGKEDRSDWTSWLLASAANFVRKTFGVTPPPATQGQGRQTVQRRLSHLVTSHALHAAILHDADTPEMRRQHEGIERFKVAAQQNATNWTQGRLVLHPLASTRQVLRYSPATKQFEPFHISDDESAGAGGSWIGSARTWYRRQRTETDATGTVSLSGPFVYLNAMLTDRLEQSFVPAPLSSAFTADVKKRLPEGAIDLVVIRPTRDPALQTLLVQDPLQARVQFARTRLGAVTTGMYSGGTHIDLCYPSRRVGSEDAASPSTSPSASASATGRERQDETAVEQQLGGETTSENDEHKHEHEHEEEEEMDLDQPVVEYFRCGGYDFTPSGVMSDSAEAEQKKAGLVCMDGYLGRADQVRVRRWTPRTTPLEESWRDQTPQGIAAGPGPLVYR
ncbi:hypothetical protein BCV70DRAFT_200198 [Testicularia cyperi]|uniref:DAGKc domain-containing protein n=1 Tax=Testicularia cyperi TaxID=1882483 RepID=A0A317XQ65_9BASI|nr:hypothetical protein BCV70DRAFT_200198 [Testicularia cyperi]